MRLALAALAAALLALAAAATFPLATTPSAPGRAAAEPLLPHFPAPPPLGELTATVERPLFAATRRPPPPPRAPSEAPAAQPAPSAAETFARYRLHGVVIDGRRRTVLLAPAGGGKPASLAVGDQLGGWTIEEIEPERLRLRNGERRETVELRAPHTK